MFMAKIVDIEEEGVVVKYMKSGFGGTYVWPASPEETLEPIENVWAISDPTKVTERGHFSFNLQELDDFKKHYAERVYFR